MTKAEIEQARTKRVRKANELIQKSRYSLSMQGHKIVLYLISQIQPEDKDFKTIEFDIREFCEICGIGSDQGNNYKDLKAAVIDIMKHPIGWTEIAEQHEAALTWIENAEITKYDGVIRIDLGRHLKPFLLDLKKNFTSYELGYTLRFRSKYSIRLYEILKSYQYHDEQPFTKVFQVDELRALLDAENYSQYRDFKKRVLSIAVDEITKYTDRNLDLREIKSGRKVLEVEFAISAKTGEALEEVRQLIGAPQRRKRTPKPIPGQMAIGDNTESRTSADKLAAMKRLYTHLAGGSTSERTV